MPKSDRLSITVSLVLLGLLLSQLVTLPSRDFSLVVLGSELKLHFSGPIQFAVIMTALVCAGVDAIMRQRRSLRSTSLAHTVPFWALPGTLTVVSMIMLNNAQDWSARLLWVAGAGVSFAGVVNLQIRSLDAPENRPSWVRLALNGIVYVLALVLFVAIYGARLRSVVSATTVMLISTWLSLELLRGLNEQITRTWLYAGIIGLAMGELTWTTNYLNLPNPVGGALLLVAFYGLAGIVQQYLGRQLSRRVLWEYGAVIVAGLLVLAGYAFWIRY